MRRSILAAVAAAALVGGGAGYVLAQGMPPAHRMPGGQMMPGMQHGQMPMQQGMQPAGPGASAPSSQAFAAAMDKMHRDMAIPYSGNADRDFVAGMIPHHQGAIDMARIVLEKGSDPEVKALAQKVIAAQESEIAEMQDWLKRKGY